MWGMGGRAKQTNKTARELDTADGQGHREKLTVLFLCS